MSLGKLGSLGLRAQGSLVGARSFSAAGFYDG